MLSVATGFAADFQSGVDGIWHLPLKAEAPLWCEQIQACLLAAQSDPDLGSGVCSPARQAFLEAAQFERLALQLRQLCDQSLIGGSMERSDG